MIPKANTMLPLVPLLLDVNGTAGEQQKGKSGDMEGGDFFQFQAICQLGGRANVIISVLHSQTRPETTL